MLCMKYFPCFFEICQEALIEIISPPCLTVSAQSGLVTSLLNIPAWPDLHVTDAAEGSREIGQIVGIN